MLEEWRDVVGYEGYYQVSSIGRVRRVRKYIYKILAPAIQPHRGYPYVALCVNSKVKTFQVHKLVAEAFIGPCPEGYEVNHKDSDRANSMVNNLEYVTRRENILHSVANGRWVVNNRLPVLTQDQADDIREKLASGYNQTELASLYEVSRGTIANVLYRRWGYA